MKMDYNLEHLNVKLFKLFPRVFKKIEVNSHGFISLRTFKLYFPLDDQE